MSLREVGVRGAGSYERGSRHRNRDGSRDSRDEIARQQRRRDHERRRRDGGETRPNGGSALSLENIDSRSQARQIEHQSSLRSLISSSDVDSSEMEEEILRQITEEGLLDGIDLDNLDMTQEDELSERIADAYRQRHGTRPRSQDTHAEESRGSGRRYRRTHLEQPQRRQAGRSPGALDQTASSSHPPVSRPHLLEAYPIRNGHRRRTSSDHRRQTSPIPGRPSSEVQRQAARSATDLSDRPQTSGSHRRHVASNSRSASIGASSEERRQASRSTTDVSSPLQHHVTRPADLSNHGRRITDSEPQVIHSRDHPRVNATHNPRPRDSEAVATVHTPSIISNVPRLPTHTSSPTQVSSSQLPDQSNSTEVSLGQRAPYPLDDPTSTARPSSSSSKLPQTQPVQYPEPSITCSRCGTPNLEYELHHNCSVCLDGNFNICLRCYRRNLGCLHWYGFGNAALLRYQRRSQPAGYPSNHTFPHILVGHRYIRPTPEGVPSLNRASSPMAVENPSKRLQSGVFCSVCFTFANNCFWKCDVCNEGEWGFCSPCVNQGKCCTHPLLPLAHASSNPMVRSSSAAQRSEASFATTLPSRSSSDDHIAKATFPGEAYKPLTFSIKCQICTYSIPPSISRFHCPQCNAGDYDVCTKCYLNLVSTGRISPENSHKGWRRCLELHRMIVVGFQDSPSGQKRVVVNELVGGHAMDDDALLTSDQTSLTAHGYTWRDGAKVQVRNSSKQSSHPNASTSPSQPLLPKKFPPNGGAGMRLSASWSYWPEEDTERTLAFPKGAVISEVVDINGDWFWGIYAGAKGFLPGNYGKVIEVVTSAAGEGS